MGVFPVILDAPFLDLDRCIVERNKDVLVEAFFPQARVETLDMRVLDRLARFNKLQPYTMVIGPLIEGLAAEFRATPSLLLDTLKLSSLEGFGRRGFGTWRCMEHRR
jgi:hypothetical protein